MSFARKQTQTVLVLDCYCFDLACCRLIRAGSAGSLRLLRAVSFRVWMAGKINDNHNNDNNSSDNNKADDTWMITKTRKITQQNKRHLNKTDWLCRHMRSINRHFDPHRPVVRHEAGVVSLCRGICRGASTTGAADTSTPRWVVLYERVAIHGPCATRRTKSARETGSSQGKEACLDVRSTRIFLV